jgi:hypothetical protein
MKIPMLHAVFVAKAIGINFGAYRLMNAVTHKAWPPLTALLGDTDAGLIATSAHDKKSTFPTPDAASVMEGTG